MRKNQATEMPFLMFEMAIFKNYCPCSMLLTTADKRAKYGLSKNTNRACSLYCILTNTIASIFYFLCWLIICGIFFKELFTVFHSVKGS